MRMWLVDPQIMCRKHLLGEHVELHMLVGTIRKRKSIQGYVDKDLIEPEMIHERHYDLIDEMKARGYKHISPLEPFVQILLDDYPKEIRKHRIDRGKSLVELLNRCPDCFALYKKKYKK